MQSNTLNFSLFTRRSNTLPFISAVEQAECGYACLTMLANYYGHNVNISSLRDMAPLSGRGTDIRFMVEVADVLMLSSRILELEIEALDQLSTPCVLHWDMNHYVVLKSVRNGKYIIHDPAEGVLTLNKASVSKHFTGYAIEYAKVKEFKPLNNAEHLKIHHLWSESSGIFPFFARMLGLILVLQGISVLVPIYSQLVIDQAIVSRDFGLLNTLLLAFLLLALMQFSVSVLQSLLGIHFSYSLNAYIAANLKHHLIKLPLQYFQQRHIGDITSRFESTENIIDFIGEKALPTIITLIMSITMLIVMFFYSAVLALLVLAFITAYILIRYVLFAKIKETTHEQLRKEAKCNSIFMETMRGMQTIRLFGMEPQRTTLWNNYFIDKLNLGIRLSYLQLSNTDMQKFLFLAENILVLYFAAKLVIASDFSLGMLFAFIAFKEQFKTNALIFIDNFMHFKMLRVYLDRISDITLTDKEKFISSSQKHPNSGQDFIIENLDFRYSSDSELLLSNISINIEHGSVVAIIGESGSGKTTLMKLMLGVLHSEKGRILYGTENINDIGLNNYRKMIATVMQDDQLFSGSLLDNISLFDHEPDIEKIRICAEQAAILDDIEAMPLKFDTMLGDMGVSLSGGQKQRIFIARALYREPSIIFMDEATSHLDINNERRVNDILKTLNITRIIIAHRRDTIAIADRFYLLKGGCLQEVSQKIALKSGLE